MASAKNKMVVVSDQPKIVPLSALKPKQENITITVRVLRIWDVYIPTRGDRPVALEMVLVDKKGTRILGRIDQSHMYKFGSMLREGAVVTISNFAVFVATGEYRPTAHECKLNLRFHSQVCPVPATEVGPPPYNFTSPELCFDKQFNKDYLVDVVGVYVDNGDESEFTWKGKNSTRMTLDLQNEGFQFTVTLFGEYTSQLKDFVDSGAASGAVIAVLFCKVGSWTGGTSIQTTQRTSRLVFNPDIPEAAVLRESSQLVLATPLTVPTRCHSQSAEGVFLNTNQRYTLADIRELMEIDEFVTTATINSIVDGVKWWYWACREDHYKCTEEEDAPGLYYCPRCDMHVERVTRTLFLKLRLHDKTEVITVTLFDNAVKMLTGRHADEVYLKWKQDGGEAKYPAELTRLIGREAIWRIKALKKEEVDFERSYKVTRVSFNEEVINKYKEKWGLEAVVEASKQEVLLIEDTPSGDAPTVAKSASGGVTEDLLEKPEDSACGSTTVADPHPMVELSNDKDDNLPLKRKTAIESESSSKVPTKAIKIEKVPAKPVKIQKVPTKHIKIEK